MKRKIPDWARAISSILIFFSSIGIYATVSSAGHKMVEAGEEMAILRSVGGTSVAEAYYQLHGEVYASMGSAISNGAAVILIAGILFSLWLFYPILPQKTGQGSQVAQNSFYTKPGTEPIMSQPVPSAGPVSNVRICPACGNRLSEGAGFCTQCGRKIDDISGE